MKSKWLHRKENTKLILFCNGWGMDDAPFLPLKSDTWNVLMVYDYCDLIPDCNIQLLFEEYEEVVLVAWSMGVWAGQQLFSAFRDDLCGALAINGTLCPVDDQFGIPVAVVQATLESYGQKQRMKFYHRMCRDRVLYREFITNQPKRTVESQKSELASLMKMAHTLESDKALYDRVLVAEHDFIIPTQNQLHFWPEKLVQRVDGYHFLFYSYNCWDEIVDGFLSSV